MSRKLWLLLAVFALAVAVLAPIGAAGAADTPQVPTSVVADINDAKTAQVYIVITGDDPVVAYEGGTAGYKATKPRQGKKVNPNSAAVRKYVGHLETSHDAALESVGADSGDKLYSYTYSVSGFAANLTEGQAAALSLQDGIRFVAPDETRYIQTENSPDFLGINDGAGPILKGYTGEGVIVGVIDTGIWPEHASFEDDGSYGPPPAGWTGTGCDFGNAAFNPSDAAFTCNNKLLAATAYGLGFHGGTGAGLASGEYLSARDADGHGTHTTSTAAGNSGVAASILGNDFGDVSGIAPRARVSMYKACWDTSPTTGGCNLSDLVAAIDQAVADGVDVINYSIGSASPAIGADDVSFLFAEAAGVHVATSAGNNGPGASTVGSPASVPWLTSVGASTQNREYFGSIDTGDGASYPGVTITSGTAAGLELVDAADHGNELCNPAGTFSPSIAGKIVLCLRGAFARVAKSQAVFNDGGAGMVLYNAAAGQTLNTDNHYVPSVHVNNTNGVAVKAYIAGEGGSGTGTIQGGTFTPTPGSVMAAFSSRGSNLLSGDIIKPDVTAPGVNVLAGNTPTALLGAPGQLFQSISGTSMSSPHVAGSFALLKQAHPDWSPAIAKSALMTTARQNVVKEDAATAADPFDMGAGHIDWSQPADSPQSPLQPGLAYDAGLFEYAAYTCGANLGVFTPGTCDFLEGIGIPTDPSDLNVPSIGVAELVGNQTVIRTVTAVTGRRGAIVFHASVDAPPGYSVSVSPSTLRLRDGDTATYEVTIINTGATLGSWSFGSLEWKGGGYTVHSPIALRAFEFAGDAAVDGTGTDSSVEVDVAFGYDGDYSTGAHGLVTPTEDPDNVQDDPANNINTALNCWFGSGGTINTPGDPACGLTLHLVPVGVDSDYARFSLFDAFTDGADDLDMYVFNSGGGFMGGSGSGTSAEQVDIAVPPMDTYSVFVHGWQTDGPDSNYTLFSWDVGADAGNMSVSGAPSSVSLGDTATLTVSWSGLAADELYLGVISHHNTAAPTHGADASLIGQTVISVDT